MKTFVSTLIIGMHMISPPIFAQESDSTGMPGDNFDLQGALELFKTAESMEAFEKALNTESNLVNNLDLNNDSEIDYIRVVDNMDGETHAIALQIDINENEAQDIAAILLEKTGDETAQLQIVGDEELYGEEIFFDPVEEVEKNQTGPSYYSEPLKVIVVNVWTWPCVRFVYRPAYAPYRSPWGWKRYPSFWRPWRPVAWRVHHHRVVRYHVFYHRSAGCFVHKGHGVYVKNHVKSATFKEKNAVQHKNYKASKQTKATPAGKNQPTQTVKKSGDAKSTQKAQSQARPNQNRPDAKAQRSGSKPSNQRSKGAGAGGGKKR